MRDGAGVLNGERAPLLVVESAMNLPRNSVRSFVSAVALALAAAAWVMFAPIQAGGQTAYAIVSGNSMEPGFRRGDLVVLRQATNYQIGDIVTYRHPELGPVIHRIIAENDGRFIFKGDNNTWQDSYQPTQAEMIGKFWMYVPHLGGFIEQLRRPWAAALLVAFGGIAVAVSVAANASRPRSKQRRRQTTLRRWPTVTQTSRSVQADLFLLLATLGVASLMLGLFAFTRPLSHTAFDEAKYQHVGTFSYSAAAPPGLYDGNVVKTGEPVFRRLISHVNVAFNYRLEGAEAQNLGGTSRLVAVLASNNGWRSDLELQGESDFRGSETQLSGVLDLSRIQAALDALEQQTGVTSSQYTLAIMPSIAISGTLSGQALRDSFSPQLVFSLDELQMHLVAQPSRGGENPAPFVPSENKSLRKSREAPNTITLLGLSLDVSTARDLSLIGLALSLLGAGALALAARRGTSDTEEARIRSHYDPLLIDVRDSNLSVGRSVVEVVSIDDLAKIAERNSRMILHQAHAGEQAYFVQEGDITYCYRSASGATPATVSGRSVPASEAGL